MIGFEIMQDTCVQTRGVSAVVAIGFRRGRTSKEHPMEVD